LIFISFFSICNWQADLGVEMGSMPLMAKGQPLDFDKVAANKYLKVGRQIQTNLDKYKGQPRHAQTNPNKFRQIQGAAPGL
jgi:hypothetical protein